MAEHRDLERPSIDVPEGVVDRSGRRLRPGSVVRVPGGLTGEVVGYRGFAGVEVLTDDDDLRAWPPDDLERTDPGDDRCPVTLGWYVVDEDPTPVSLIFPVGARDIQPREDLGPFPDPQEFVADRVMGSGVAARAWGGACVDRVRGESDEEAGALVSQHLDAPMLRRVLVEASLPSRISRVTMLVTDQHPAHPDDTIAFGELLRLWLIGTADTRARGVDEIAEPLVLDEGPHLLESVFFAVGSHLDRLLIPDGRLVIAQAGGTPAMAQGTLLAAAMHAERPLRHIYVPHNQPLVEIDFPPLRPLREVPEAH